MSLDSLAQVEVLEGSAVVELFQGCESGATVILRTTTALFITEVLSSIWSEQT